MYHSHITLEMWYYVKAIDYIFKYVYKTRDYDFIKIATLSQMFLLTMHLLLHLHQGNHESVSSVWRDEICRYVSPAETT